MSINKIALQNQILIILSEKIIKLEDLIVDTRASNNDTKSSMGDKYETGREMLQQQINNLQLQINALQQQYQVVKNLNLSPKKLVGIGSYIKTSKSNFFIAASVGEIQIDDEFCFVVSDKSPIAQALLNKQQQDDITFNHQHFQILEIL